MIGFNTWGSQIQFGLAANRPTTPPDGTTTNPNTADAQTQGNYKDGFPLLYFATDTGALSIWNPLTQAWAGGPGSAVPTLKTVAAPVAPASTSVYKMQGLAATFTPMASGTARITVSGTITSSTVTAGDGINLQISYGTGSAPANAATLAGTQVGPIVTYKNPTTVTAADVAVPFSVTAIATGLVAGTAYWVDLAAESVATASSCAITAVTVAVS